MSHQRIELTVLKVFSASDGGAIFRAYLVNWKDQEVVVSDPLMETSHQVGDTITILALDHPFPNERKPHRLLSFLTL